MASAISQDSSFDIEDQDIGLGSSQFTHDHARSVPAGHLQLDKAVVLDLMDVVQPGPLEVSAEKLAEGGWCRWVEMGASGEMQPGVVRVTGDQQPMGLTRHPNVKHDRVSLWLMDLLYPAAT